MSPETKLTKGRRPQQIVEQHVKCNVTGLISELVECDSDLGLLIMHGDPESHMRAYEAYEVWCVSDWLAGQLKLEDHRVQQVWGQHYWARGATGQAIWMDDVIEAIAKKE